MNPGGAKSLALWTALLALGWLGWSAWHPAPDDFSSVTAVTLLTAGASDAGKADKEVHVALPGAQITGTAAKRAPDVAYVRRTFPRLERIEIIGDGIEDDDVPLLGGLTVTWSPPAELAAHPSLHSLSAPRSVVVGQRPVIQGQATTGTTTPTSLTLTLENPDGTTQSAEFKSKDRTAIPFSLEGSAALVPGRLEWKVLLGPGGIPGVIGIDVLPAVLPRLLLLSASPNPETSRLQRWLAESGAKVASRTRVSAANDRVASANQAPAEIPQIDAPLLAGFDLVVATEPALLELSPAERSVLEESITAQGLGLLVTGEASAPGPGHFFSPWKLTPPAELDTGNETRTARLKLPGGPDLLEPASLLPEEIAPAAFQQALGHDVAGRILVAATTRGSGRIGRSLVVDTWRWLQGGHPAEFAGYWTHLLSALARRSAAPDGTWALRFPANLLAIDQRAELMWSGNPASRPTGITVGATKSKESFPLDLAPDSRDPSIARGLYWPATTGWHVIRNRAGESLLSFFVQPSEALPAVRLEQRHRATALAVAASTSNRPALTASGSRVNRRLVDGLAFLLFLIGAGYLWLEQRKSPSG